MQFIERPEAWYFAGDSHTMIFDNLLFAGPDGKHVLTRSEHHRYFLAHEVTGWGDRLEERLWRSLLVNNFLGVAPPERASQRLPTITTTQCGARIEEGLGAGIARAKPLVLMCGEIDTRNILSQFKGTTDIELPFPAPQLEALPPLSATRTIPAAEIVPFFEREFAPLRTGLEILREAGLQAIYLHSIPPPTIDDDDAARVLTFARPARVRYKVALLVNWLYARYCAETGVQFLNIWDEVTHAGLLAREFYLDGLHLNKRAAFLTLDRLAALRGGPGRSDPLAALHPLFDEAG